MDLNKNILSGKDYAVYDCTDSGSLQLFLNP
jgi:hypothetical protein